MRDSQVQPGIRRYSLEELVIQPSVEGEVQEEGDWFITLKGILSKVHTWHEEQHRSEHICETLQVIWYYLEEMKVRDEQDEDDKVSKDQGHRESGFFSHR